MNNPRGFFKLDRTVVWATGSPYIRDGSNPFRTEVIQMCGHHGLLMQSAGNDALTARPLATEVRDWVDTIELDHQRRATEIKVEAQRRCDALQNEINLYRARLSDFEREWGGLLP